MASYYRNTQIDGSLFSKRPVCAYNLYMSLSLQHIHLVSPDKFKLADWYCKHLGFSIIEDLEAIGEHKGPVLISSDNGVTGLSIFTSTNKDNTSLPAFSTDALSFIDLLRKFLEPRVYDHYHFVSFYTKDGDGNKLEICCMSYQTAIAELEREKIEVFLMNPDTYIP